MDYLSYFDKIIDSHDKSFKEKTVEMIKFYQQNPEGEEAIEKYTKLSVDLNEAQVVRNCLKLGDKIPDFSLSDSFGELKTVNQLFTSEWLILVFYRGQFCPFCSLQLRSLQKHLPSIENCPANLVAISPQNVAHSLETVVRNQLNYTVLSDENFQVGSLFGLAFTAPQYMVEFHLKTGVPKDYLDEDGRLKLFVPAVYIVDKNRTIRYRFLETNAAKRMDPIDIVNFILSQTHL